MKTGRSGETGMNVRTIILVLSVFFLVAGQRVFAQGAEPPAKRATQMALKLKGVLSLTDGQTAHVVEIMALSRQRAVQDLLTYHGNREALVRAKWERIDATHREIESILTGKQMERYETLKRDSRERFRERMKERTGNLQESF